MTDLDTCHFTSSMERVTSGKSHQWMLKLLNTILWGTKYLYNSTVSPHMLFNTCKPKTISGQNIVHRIEGNILNNGITPCLPMWCTKKEKMPPICIYTDYAWSECPHEDISDKFNAWDIPKNISHGVFKTGNKRQKEVKGLVQIKGELDLEIGRWWGYLSRHYWKNCQNIKKIVCQC